MVKCDVDGCDKLPRRSKGLCEMHYKRKQLTGDVRGAESEKIMHGLSKHPLYGKWSHIVQRCSNTSDKEYSNYGGRGITVHESWLKFLPFYFWAVENGWTPELTIERLDVNGNYEPHNCSFIPMSEQSENKRSNIRLTAFNETKLMQEWSKDTRCTISQATLSRRVAAGWEHEKAITTPSLTIPKQQCKYGHAYTPENTYILPSTGRRYCIMCKRMWQTSHRLNNQQLPKGN